MYRDNDSGLRPSSYPYILGRALNEYRISTSVTIYYVLPEGGLYNNDKPTLLHSHPYCMTKKQLATAIYFSKMFKYFPANLSNPFGQVTIHENS